MRQIKPGVSVAAANDSGKAVVTKGLVRLGLIQSADGTIDPPEGAPCPPGGCQQVQLFALHGYGGHGIGLDVHDPAQYLRAAFRRRRRVHRRARALCQPGPPGEPARHAEGPAFLAKIKPAVQKYSGIGVRIEDDYALTEKGLEWMSSGAPREIPEIEALMRQREPELSGGGPATASHLGGHGACHTCPCSPT